MATEEGASSRRSYRYEQEAKAIQSGLCPLCGTRVLLTVTTTGRVCPKKTCPFAVLMEDWHKGEGWAIMRGRKDTLRRQL